MTYHLPVPENPIARDILSMIAEVSRCHPRKGWDQVDAIERFESRAIEMSGATADNLNLVACLDFVGLSLFDAVETFVRAKHPEKQDPSRKIVKGAVHVSPVAPPPISSLPPPDVLVVSAPADRAAVPGDVVPPERSGDPVRSAARAGPDLAADGAAVVAAGEGPVGNPGVRRPVHRPDPKPKPGRKAKPVEPPSAQQDSLF